MRWSITLAVLFWSVAASQAQYGPLTDLKILKPEDTVHMKSVSPPPGAVILFDGKNLNHWIKTNGKDPATWTIDESGAMQVKGGNIMTKEKFSGHFKLHVEFRVPYEPKNKGQGRANSGVYVQGRYEVQVLDSYGLASKNNDCGAIYEVAAPMVNACKAPTIWQSYDIEFTAPRCENGKKVEPTMMTVYHNGVLIHDKVKIPSDNTRAGMGGDPCSPGPIMLQDHGNPVQYRNIWLVQLDRPAVTQEPKLSTMDDYWTLADQALKQNKPIVVWVGVKAPAIEKALDYCFHILLDAFPESRPNAIVLGIPAGTYLRRIDLPGSASLNQIRAVLPRTGIPLPYKK